MSKSKDDCYGCTDRYPFCHEECERWAKRKARDQERKRRKYLETITDSYEQARAKKIHDSKSRMRGPR